MPSVLLVYGTPIALLLIGFFVGRWLEQRHFRSLEEREQRWRSVPMTDLDEVPDPERVEFAFLVHGNVSVSVDYFKRLAAWLRQLFGGEIRVYGSLLDRARREASLRMKEQCQDADLFVNCRYETATIHQGQSNAIACVEVMAYGTAVRYRR